MSYGACKWCGNPLTDREMFHGDLCDACELEAEQEEAEQEEADAIEAEYEDACWDLAHDYGYDQP